MSSTDEAGGRPQDAPRQAPAQWRCPQCGRRFVRPRQMHSCQVVPIIYHLDRASPLAREIYEAIIGAVRACGPVQIAPTKTSISLLSGTSLGGIALHRAHVSLGLVLTRRVEDARVASVLQLSPRSFAHKFKIQSVADVDRQLRRWIREAYRVGLMAGRRR